MNKPKITVKRPQHSPPPKKIPEGLGKERPAVVPKKTNIKMPPNWGKITLGKVQKAQNVK